MKKYISLLLLSCLLLSSLAACGGEGQAPDAGGAAETASQGGDEAPADDAAAETELAPNLPALDCGGEEFHVLTKMENDESGRWTARDIWVEAENGEIVNDAVFERNRLIEEKYNTTITQSRMAIGGQYSYSMTKEITKLVMAGDASFDLIMPTIQDAAALARDGLLYDLNTLGNIDLSKPWWNQQFEKDTRIGGHNYIGDGDICMTFMRSTYAILFNKKLFNDLSFDNPYEVVNNGGWNIDYMLGLARGFAQDIDGNGKLTEDDNVGLLRIFNQIEALYTASGAKMVTADSEGNFRFEGDSEKSLAILDQIFKLFNDKESVVSTNVEKAAETFEADRGLLLFGTMNNVPNMRDMTADFGILPLPKSLDSQEQYYSYVQTWASGCAALYIITPDIEKSSVITEDMAYHAMKILTPAYYETALKTKYARDEESQAMLDLIYSVRTCDLGNLYNIGDVVSGVTDLVNNGKDTFSSFMESKLDKINTTLEELSEMYAG